MYEPYWVLQVVISGVCGVFIVFVNAVVLISFVIDRGIREPKNYFIISIAVTDLLIGLTSIPIYTQYVLLGKWVFGRYLCDFWLSFAFSVFYSMEYSILLITMDRYLCVRIPGKYFNWRTKKNIIGMIAAFWLLPSVVNFTIFLGWETFTGKTNKEGECEVHFIDYPIVNFCHTFFFFWIPLLITSILYGGIFRISLNLRKKHEAKVKDLNKAFLNQGKVSFAPFKDYSRYNKNNNTCNRLSCSLGGVKNNENLFSDESICRSPKVGMNIIKERSQFVAAVSKTLLLRQGSVLIVFTEHSNSILNVIYSIIYESRRRINGKKDQDKKPIHLLFPSCSDKINESMDTARVGCFIVTMAEMGRIDPTDVHDNWCLCKYRSTNTHQLCFKPNIGNSNTQSFSVFNCKLLSIDLQSDMIHWIYPIDLLKSNDVSSHSFTIRVHKYLNHNNHNSLEIENNTGRNNSLAVVSSNSKNKKVSLTPPRTVIEKPIIIVTNTRDARKQTIISLGSLKNCPARLTMTERHIEDLSKWKKRKTKPVNLISIIIGSIIIFQLPYHTVVLLSLFGFSVPTALYTSVYWLCYVNAAVNPFCFAYVNPRLRRTFLRVIRCEYDRL